MSKTLDFAENSPEAVKISDNSTVVQLVANDDEGLDLANAQSISIKVANETGYLLSQEVNPLDTVESGMIPFKIDESISNELPADHYYLEVWVTKQDGTKAIFPDDEYLGFDITDNLLSDIGDYVSVITFDDFERRFNDVANSVHQMYYHVMYADDDKGTGMEASPNNHAYMGTLIDTNQTASTIASDYQWAKIQGPKGDKGDKGDKGETGAPGKDWVSNFTTTSDDLNSITTSGIYYSTGTANSPTGGAGVLIVYNVKSDSSGMVVQRFISQGTAIVYNREQGADGNWNAWQTEKGDKGDKGDTGAPGKDGSNGRDGTDGKDGNTPSLDTESLRSGIDGYLANVDYAVSPCDGNTINGPIVRSFWISSRQYVFFHIGVHLSDTSASQLSSGNTATLFYVDNLPGMAWQSFPVTDQGTATVGECHFESNYAKVHFGKSMASGTSSGAMLFVIGVMPV